MPGYRALGWSGKWDNLPAAHVTAIAFDLLALLGLLLVGRRFGGARLAVTLAFAWAAYPFTQYASSSNTNDAIMPRVLIWGFWLVTSRLRARRVCWRSPGGRSSPRSWSCRSGPGYPEGRRLVRKGCFCGGFVAATLAAFSMLLLEPNPAHAARVFWDRTFGWQVGRESPFSIWDWGQYHAAGIPDLALRAAGRSTACSLSARVACYFVPRRKTPLQLAALTAALLIGFELVADALVLPLHPVVLPVRRLRRPGAAPAAGAAPPPSDSEARELVPAG